VRPLLLASLFALTALPLLAQEQERKLMDRLMKPNMEQEFDTRQSRFGNRSSVKAKPARTKSFNPSQNYSAKSFRSKEYGGTKTAWSGDFRQVDKKAPTKGRYEVANATREVPVKTKDVADARESNKGAGTREYAGLRSFWKRGRSQDRFDKEGGLPQDEKPVGWTGELKPMTIDDVRELLNKNE
jgi:hypothetical protein